MTIQVLYDKKEDIPENVQDLYTERDGKWHLTGVVGMKTQADVERLQSALTKERADHRALKDKYSVLADMDIDEVLAKLDRYPELEAASGGKIDENKINELVENRLRSKLAPTERQLNQTKQQLADATREIEEFRSRERQRKIHDAVRAAATTAKLRPEAVEDALLYGERIFDVSEDGAVIAKDNVGVTPGIEPSVWLTEMQTKRPHWYGESSGSGGRGSQGGGQGGSNPWSAQNWNMTEQGRILRENPDRAKQLAASAGTSIGGPRPQMNHHQHH